ncbi:EmrB/QacA family drug resistance transporter [Erwinia sp. OLTSP20]|uniref:DHA2 family efflux MFS transporter permease subunit n=1 Tax=unclassified Erwinia TaxID=2622719 RepID=UPI000C1773DC|nr:MULTISPECIES: DHA2 family efflux MFS transporter permease subunit [unclassified Erwinia]PIJ48677.1 EmrB/QacA family drug resistance transporter [Erwinia sp. OAMSP11]PIJ69301.1 EmrB/QacA family drug resistance transporter [Erwinia sp. OLSSP12]PIJ79135.1 EmrB/QacA family drug resistance transporter [Erwinia sp. OLCASP19]PIJ80661.1 EmrB/QacA family drug resistance transporter [Erwinia sp. OLMTSP26]PIJ82812.1 EmrB/QacA family drug resistance transporter [Erwinia sp. OLMDSP33]
MNQATSWKPVSNPWLVAMVVTVAVFMEILDTTIVNVALPHIAGSLSSSYDESTWVLTSYLVANGIVLPISAFLSRVFGRKMFFMICIVMFTVCSLLCGIATELWQIILFRVLQGFFGGGLQPVQQSVLLDYFKAEDRGKAFGLSSIAVIVAPVMGPTLGGWITDNYSWRWVFFINIPVGILCVIAIYQLLEDPPWEKRWAPSKLKIDYIGISLITLGLGCLQVMLDRGEDEDWFNSRFIVLFAVLTLVGLVGAVYWLLYARRPVVDLSVMKDRNFWVAGLLMAGMATILYGSSVVIPQLAQQDLGYTATWSGLVLSPGAVLIILTIPLVLKLMPLVQTRWIIAFGFVCLAVSFIYCAGLTPDIDFTTLMLMRSAQTIGLGFLFVPLTTIAFITIPQRLNADASALFTMFRNVSGSVGISLCTAAITERQQTHSACLSAHMTPLDASFNQTLARWAQAVRDFSSLVGDPTTLASGKLYQEMIAQARILAYIDVFIGLSIFALILLPFCFLLSPVKSEGSAGAH